MVIRLRRTACFALVAALAAAPAWAQPQTGSGGVVRPAPPPAPSAAAREMAAHLAEASAAHLETAKNLVLSAVQEIDPGTGDLRRLVERAWTAQFDRTALEAELAVEIASRFPAADQQAAARWEASVPALRLEIARTMADAPPRASIDPGSLTGDDAERWRLAERMVDVCDLFERGTALLLTVNMRASVAALRLTGLSEETVEARRKELEQGLRAQLESGRPAMRERALRSTYVANRRAPLADLRSELDFFESPAGQARCRAQTDALETVLVRRIDDLPRAVTAAAAKPSS